MSYFGETMDAACFVISTNDVILNHSCRDMKVGVSYVMVLHKTETRNSHFYVLISLTVYNWLFRLFMN